MEGPPRYPFEILPKEMWEKIILEVRDYQDFQNLMKASEQLNLTFSGIRHLWLLEKVLPLLTTTGKNPLELEDVKKLRLVNKPWCRAVNTFLENQPSLRPYSKDDDKVNSEEHIWDDNCRIIGERIAPGTVALANFSCGPYCYSRLVKALIANFENPKNNPFIARSLVGLEWRLEYNPQDQQPFWGEMENDVFKMFGKHVWFLNMIWSGCGRLILEQEFLWRDIVISLSSLPNIKSFQLQGLYNQLPPISESAAQELLQSEKGQLPSLPFLESLKIADLTEVAKPFSQQLVSKYSLQLRRLHIRTLDWDSSKEWTLYNLTELCLSGCNESVEVTEILESLKAPQLAKFKLEAPSSLLTLANDYCKLKMEEEIFFWLTLMPALLHLDISEDYVVSESGNLEPKQDSKPSLKYLKIYNSAGVNYNFLRCLPNLQRLQIRLQNRPVVWDCSAYPEIRIKLELETCSLYQSNVWELCPRLRTLSLCCSHREVRRDRAWQMGKSHDVFDRETYEKLKINPSLDLRKCANLSPGIVDFPSFCNRFRNIEQESEESEDDEVEGRDDERLEDSETGSD